MKGCHGNACNQLLATRSLIASQKANSVTVQYQDDKLHRMLGVQA